MMYWEYKGKKAILKLEDEKKKTTELATVTENATGTIFVRCDFISINCTYASDQLFDFVDIVEKFENVFVKYVKDHMTLWKNISDSTGDKMFEIVRCENERTEDRKPGISRKDVGSV